MKKIVLLIGIVSLLTITFSSCKKDWTCTCTTGSISVDATISNTTLADAKNTCDDMSIGTITTCKLK